LTVFFFQGKSPKTTGQFVYWLIRFNAWLSYEINGHLDPNTGLEWKLNAMTNGRDPYIPL